MQWILLAAVLYIVYRDFIKPRLHKQNPIGWHMELIMTDGVQVVIVDDGVFEQLKVWLRGEGDSLFEIQSESGYLGFKRAYVVSVTAERK